MVDRVNVGGLQVAGVLHAFVREEALPGSGVDEDKFWAGVCQRIGLPELAADERFVPSSNLVANAAEAAGHFGGPIDLTADFLHRDMQFFGSSRNGLSVRGSSVCGVCRIDALYGRGLQRLQQTGGRSLHAICRAAHGSHHVIHIGKKAVNQHL